MRLCRLRLVLPWIFVASSHVAGGDDAVDQAIRNLGVDEADLRESATVFLSKAAREMEEAGKRAEFARILKRLREARTSAEPEVKARADHVLAPFLAGGVVWLRRREDLPASVEIWSPADGKLLLGGWDGGPFDEERGWIALYDLRDGSSKWVRKPGEFPGRVDTALLLPDGVLVGGWWDIKRRNGWMALLDVRDGSGRWKAEKEALPGAVYEMGVCGGDVIVGGADAAWRGWLRSIHAGDRSVRWERKSLPGSVSSMDPLSGGWIVLGLGNSGAWVGYFDKKGEPVWELKPGELPGHIWRIQSDGDRLFLGGHGKGGGWLECRRIQDGKIAWTQAAADLPGNVDSFHVAQEILVWGRVGGKGWVEWRDSRTGRIGVGKVPLKMPEGIVCIEALSHGSLVAGLASDDPEAGCLSCYDRDWKLLWQGRNLPGPVRRLVVLSERILAHGDHWVGVFRMKDADAE